MGRRDKQTGGGEPLARVQCEAPAAAPERDADYNLWWGESRQTKKRKREERRDAPSATRCDPARDSGRTKGGAGADACLFFARGCCHLGWRCDRRHRAPAASDPEPSNELDVFGRPRDGDDGDGTRSFGQRNSVARACRTLWLGHCSAPEAAVRAAFAAFGAVERARAVPAKTCVFVTMATRAQAEFAKEAMDRQVVGGELLSVVRWAQDDPNPAAARAAAADHAATVLDAAAKAPAVLAADPRVVPDAAPADAPPPPLADGWSPAFDAASGRTYYYRADGAVTWDRAVATSVATAVAATAAAPPPAVASLVAAYSSSDDES